MNTFRDTLRKLVPVMPPARIDRLWRAYLASNNLERRELENLVEAYAARLLKDNPAEAPAGLFPPPPPESCLGEIDLGYTMYGGEKMSLFGLRLEELQRHLGIYGSSGCGKSNAIALIVDGFIQNKVPFMLLDFKRSARGLLKDCPKELRQNNCLKSFPILPGPNGVVPVTMKVIWAQVDSFPLLVGDLTSDRIPAAVQPTGDFQSRRRCCAGDQVHHGGVVNQRFAPPV